MGGIMLLMIMVSGSFACPFVYVIPVCLSCKSSLVWAQIQFRSIMLGWRRQVQLFHDNIMQILQSNLTITFCILAFHLLNLGACLNLFALLCHLRSVSLIDMSLEMNELMQFQGSPYWACTSFSKTILHLHYITRMFADSSFIPAKDFPGQA